MSQAKHTRTGPSAPAPTGFENFLSGLLAPLPEGEEAVDCPRFRKMVAEDMNHAWAEGMLDVRAAEALHTYEANLFWRGVRSGEASMLLAHKLATEAKVRQCRIPAPTMKELRWKRKIIPRFLDAEARTAIAADCQRLDPARN